MVQQAVRFLSPYPDLLATFLRRLRLVQIKLGSTRADDIKQILLAYAETEQDVSLKYEWAVSLGSTAVQSERFLAQLLLNSPCSLNDPLPYFETSLLKLEAAGFILLEEVIVETDESKPADQNSAWSELLPPLNYRYLSPPLLLQLAMNSATTNPSRLETRPLFDIVQAHLKLLRGPLEPLETSDEYADWGQVSLSSISLRLGSFLALDRPFSTCQLLNLSQEEVDRLGNSDKLRAELDPSHFSPFQTIHFPPFSVKLETVWPWQGWLALPNSILLLITSDFPDDPFQPLLRLEIDERLAQNQKIIRENLDLFSNWQIIHVFLSPQPLEFNFGLNLPSNCVIKGLTSGSSRDEFFDSLTTQFFVRHSPFLNFS